MSDGVQKVSDGVRKVSDGMSDGMIQFLAQIVSLNTRIPVIILLTDPV